MKRVAVIGSGGAGKSVFSRDLAKRTGLPVVHLDREYRVRHAQGRWVHLHDRSFVVRDAEGRALRLIGQTYAEHPHYREDWRP